MTNTNVAQIAKSKMSQAIVLFGEIHTQGYPLNGDTQRAVFIKRAMAEIVDPKTGQVNCSKHCAATYFQNISNHVNKGQPLYKYNKYKAKGTKATKADVAEAEAQVLLALPHLAKERWMVLDGATEVNNFKSREEAKTYAKDHGLKWADRNKAA